MEFIRSLWKNKKLIWQLGKNDFKNRFASTSLGLIFGFVPVAALSAFKDLRKN